MFKKVHRIAKEWGCTIYNACFNRPIGYIYMFHMVRPKDDLLASVDGLRVSPEFFEAFLIKQKRRMDFVPIDKVPERIANKKQNKRPFGVITFDDGYEDNFIYAYPILKQLNIPFAIYVSVGLVKDHSPIWNYPLIIERIICKNTELIIEGKKYECKTEQQKDDTFHRLKSLLFSLPYDHMQEEFKRLFTEYLTDDVFTYNTLSWLQIGELARDPLCTIGSHTMTHSRLTITDGGALKYELEESKRILEQHIGKSVQHLSYPYGWIDDVSDEAIEYARQIGYKTAMRSYGGPVRKKDNDLYQLKRIMIHE